MANWRSVGLSVIGAAIILTAAWTYREVELLRGKAAFVAKNYPQAAHRLGPFSGWDDAGGQAALAAMYAGGLGVKEDDGRAFALATRSANVGLAFAETLLGTLYEQGKGTAVDDTQAAFWFRQAALQGDAEAETKLGEAYTQGIGVGQDYAQAAALFQQATDQADPVAENDLGRLYEIGLGEPRDDAQAAALFQRSATQGNLDAAVNLGVLYRDGDGVPADQAKAVSLFAPAAAAGRPAAAYDLGLAYAKGEGVAADPAQAEVLLRRAAVAGDAAAPVALGRMLVQASAPDAVLAYMLFDVAAAQGNAQAAAALGALAGEMSPAQVAAGQVLAGQWRVGAALPVTGFEEKAPQLVFGMAAKPGVYQASAIWFSRAFTLAGQDWHVSFIATAGKNCSPCGTMISAATFWPGGAAGQADFAMAGAGGAAPDAGGAVVLPMTADRVAVLVPVAGGATEVFGFALADAGVLGSGAWRDLGRIVTAGGAADCTGPCASWRGVVAVVPAGPGAWPDIAVKATGTVLDKGKNPVAAPDEDYRFNGKSYGLIMAAANKT